MPELNITRSYGDGEVLLETDLVNLHSSVVTLNNTTKYDGDNIQDNAITTTHLVDDSVTTAMIGVGEVTTNKIADSAVTTAKIDDLDVTTAKIDDLDVTTAKIADLNVTTAKFSTAARLSSSKIAAKSVFSGSNASPTTVNSGGGETTVATVNITADTRYCLAILQPYDTTTAYLEAYKSSGQGGVTGAVTIKKNGSTLATRSFGLSNSNTTTAGRNRIRLPLSSVSVLINASLSNGDTITATLSIGSSGTGSGSVTVTACKLYVIEL